MRLAYLASVFLHVIAAMTWVGGMMFLVAVVVPMLRKPNLRERAAEMLHLLAGRFRIVGWVALATLVTTGVFNLVARGFGVGQILSGEVFAGAWGRALSDKLKLVALAIALSAVHDFWIGPKALRLAEAEAPAGEREKFRKAASIMGRANFVIALVIVGLAATLVR